jgi:hypothetical protein
MDNNKHYCDDPSIGGAQHDLSFDYSVFRCREANCQTCLDLNPDCFPARSLIPGDQWISKDPKSKDIHVTWKSLVESASGGCEVCGVLEEGLRVVGRREMRVDLENVFCVGLLEGFTVRVTQEKPMEQGTLGVKDRFAVEFHCRSGMFTFRDGTAFLRVSQVKLYRGKHSA